MRVYLIRHATAGDATPDELRELTDRGREEALGVGLGLRQLGAQLTTILTSPLLRARQTATLIAQFWNPVPAVKKRDELSCGASPRAILSLAQEGARQGEIALVGHNPDLSTCTAILLNPPPSPALRFSPASVCCLEILGNEGVELVWFRTADELGSLGPPAPGAA